MAKQKLERNKLFLQDWQKGFSNQDLGRKYKMSKGGVKALKQRLRVRNPELYTEKRPALTKVEREGIEEVGKRLGKVVKVQVGKSPQVNKSISPLVHKRATYYLSPETIKKIKQIALDRDLDTSALVREILNKYLKNK